MLGLQGPDRPWTILFGVRLHEPVAVDRIAAAWRSVAEARPEVAVTLSHDLTWVPATPLDPVIGAVEPMLDHAMRPGVDQPVAIVVDADPATSVRFVVNHAHADGIGVQGMADDLLRALTGMPIGSRTPMTDHHLDRLRIRRPALRAALRQVPPRRLATIDTDPTAATVLDIVDLDRRALDERRRTAGVSVSTMLIEATHRAIRTSGVTDQGRIALGVPADLRRHVEQPDGIGNAVVNLTFAPASPPTSASIDEFLRTEATTRRLGETLSWIRRAGRPKLPRTTQRSGRSVATVVLSNLGLVRDEPQWKPVRSLELVAPAHQTTAIGFIALRDTLTVTVRSRGDVGGLADAIVSALDG